ncbi:MAG: DUF481 domain-containing protein [Myxococcota bacterium]|nr:DUF481 domain-containing protein [Myxococcota bacterium]
MQPIRVVPWLALLAGLILLPAVAVADAEPPETYDEITVKGQTLRGTIVRMGSETVEFETIYGQGTLRIPLEDLEDVQTDEPFRVYFGDHDETMGGQLVGVRDGMLLVGDTPDEAVTVALDEIRFGVSQPEYEKSFLNRLRSDFRHWNAELELSLNFEEGAVEKQKVRIGGLITRRRDPLRLRLQYSYAFDQQKRRDNPRQTTKDEFAGVLLGEYTVWKKLFVFGLMGGEFDRPRKVEARLFPTGGVGYRVYDSERAELSPRLGFGWVFNSFQDDFDNKDFASLYLGLVGSYEFENGALLRGEAAYWPGLSDPSDDWLFRSEVSLTVPVWDPISIRGTIININDDNPTEDTGNNKFETLFGIVLTF